MPAMQPTNQQVNGISNAELNSYVSKIGGMLRRNQVSKNGGKDDKYIKQIDEAYRQFTDTVKDQEDWMKKATDEQKEVFRGITENFYKLRRADKDDLDSLHKEFRAAIVRLNEIDGDHPTKGKLEQAAALGMQHTDPSLRVQKPTGLFGALKGELNSRAANYFKPTKDDLESPLFRHLAGLDKKGPGVLNPLTELQNQGTAEKLIREAGEKITGEDVKTKGGSMASEIAGGAHGSGSGGNGFPSKIENLHVENLIVRSVSRGESSEVGATAQPRFNRSATPLLTGPGDHANSGYTPVLPHDPSPTLIEHSKQAQIGHTKYPALPAPKHNAEDVEYHEVEPIKVKPRNPHAKLKTSLTPLAAAVSGAIGSAPAMSSTSGLMGAVRGSDDLPSNDIGPRSADATLSTDDGTTSSDSSDGLGLGGLATAAVSAASELFKKKGKGDEKTKGSEEKTKGEAKENVKENAASENVKPKGTEEGIAGEKALAGEAKAGSKLLKGASKLGKVAGIAGVALTAANSYGEYTDAEKQLAAGKITAQQAKEAKAHAVGGGLGSVVGGYLGGAIGGVAGSFVAPGVGTLAGGAVGSYYGSEAGEWVGDKLGSLWAKSPDPKDVQQVAKNAAESSKPVVVVNQTPPQTAAPTKPSVVPIKAEPRARESYFDRQMLNTVWF